MELLAPNTQSLCGLTRHAVGLAPMKLKPFRIDLWKIGALLKVFENLKCQFGAASTVIQHSAVLLSFQLACIGFDVLAIFFRGGHVGLQQVEDKAPRPILCFVWVLGNGQIDVVQASAELVKSLPDQAPHEQGVGRQLRVLPPWQQCGLGRAVPPEIAFIQAQNEHGAGIVGGGLQVMRLRSPSGAEGVEIAVSEFLRRDA